MMDEILSKITDLYDKPVSIFTSKGNVYTGKIQGLADTYLLFGESNFLKTMQIEYNNISFLCEKTNLGG